MSTLAIWLFIGVALLLVAAVAGVLRAAMSTVRKGKQLVYELDGLSQDVTRTVGSHQHHRQFERDG